MIKIPFLNEFLPISPNRLRQDDWLSTKNSLLSSNPVSPHTTTSPTSGGGVTSTPYSVISTNGYPSPTESYPYSPTDKRKSAPRLYLESAPRLYLKSAHS